MLLPLHRGLEQWSSDNPGTADADAAHRVHQRRYDCPLA
jgi:hypothetical protein